MAGASYSKSVLAGLKKNGLLPDEVRRITKMSASRIQAVLHGKAGFTDAQLTAIENATNMSAGELAMASVTPDKALRSVMGAWGDYMRSERKSTHRLPKKSSAVNA